jgi:predicted Rossmann-fold nucleotide-binding protein
MAVRLKAVDALREGDGALVAAVRQRPSNTEAELYGGIFTYNALRYHNCQKQLIDRFRLGVYGAVRAGPETEEYKYISKLTRTLLQAVDIDIVTGGGPGLMEAAHLGVILAGKDVEAEGRKLSAERIGIGLKLPSRLDDRNELVGKYYQHLEFSSRLQHFSDITHAAYVAPGGRGTFQELLHFVVSKSEGHLEQDFPIMVHPFWKGVIDVIHQTVYTDRVAQGQTPFSDLSGPHNFVYTDSIPEVIEMVTNYYHAWQIIQEIPCDYV